MMSNDQQWIRESDSEPPSMGPQSRPFSNAPTTDSSQNRGALSLLSSFSALPFFGRSYIWSFSRRPAQTITPGLHPTHGMASPEDSSLIFWSQDPVSFTDSVSASVSLKWGSVLPSMTQCRGPFEMCGRGSRVLELRWFSWWDDWTPSHPQC